MLKSVKRPDGETVSFEYDPLGRRISKTYQDRTTRWVWDGNNPLHEWTDEEKREGAGDENLITWLFEEGSFVPTAKIVGNKAYSIITDYLGTPTHAFDSKGDKIWERELDIYGKAREGDSSFIPFLYQGQYFDEETDLCYNRFRYYSPDTGAYISQDPIGLAGGNPTLYGYVFDSNAEIDPFGLSSVPVDRFPSWMPTKQGYQRHHIVPYSLRNHTLFQKSGLDINNATNMKYLPVAEGIDPNPNKSLHKGYNSVHADYNDIMGKRLDALERVATKEKWSQTRIQTEIHNLQHRTRAELDSGKLKCH